MFICEGAVKKLGRSVTVYLDDGHGFDPVTGEVTAGKRTPRMPDGTVVYENQFNSAVVEMVGSLLAYHGVRAVPVAREAGDVSLFTRADRANQDWKGSEAVFLSVHYNALNGVFDNKSGGVETFHYPGSTKGKILADMVQRHVLKGTPQVDRKVKTARFYVLKYTHMPAVLVECGFMDNLKEARHMLSMTFQMECAEELTQALCEYFKIVYDPYVKRALRAVYKAFNAGWLENKQYWMDCLMGYQTATAQNLLALMEE